MSVLQAPTPRVPTVRFDGKSGETVAFDGKQHRSRQAVRGYITSVSLYYDEPSEVYPGGPHVRLVVSEEPNGTPAAVVEFREVVHFCGSLFNALATRPVNGSTLYEFGVRSSGDGNDATHRLYVLRDGVDPGRRFEWDPAENWFTGLSLPVDTGVKNGTRTIYDRRAVVSDLREAFTRAASEGRTLREGELRPGRFADLTAELAGMKKNAGKDKRQAWVLAVRHDLLTYGEQAAALRQFVEKFGEDDAKAPSVASVLEPESTPAPSPTAEPDGDDPDEVMAEIGDADAVPERADEDEIEY